MAEDFVSGAYHHICGKQRAQAKVRRYNPNLYLARCDGIYNEGSTCGWQFLTSDASGVVTMILSHHPSNLKSDPTRVLGQGTFADGLERIRS